MSQLFTTTCERRCEFTPDRKYRYRLEIIHGDPDGPAVNALMLNPSIANEVRNDPTVERMCRRAFVYGMRGFKFDRLIVTNIHGIVDKDRSVLRKVADPTGPDNDRHIVQAAKESMFTVCGWGNDGAYSRRAADVLQMLAEHAIQTYVLGLTNIGHPKHPLYVKYEDDIKPWNFKTGELGV